MIANKKSVFKQEKREGLKPNRKISRKIIITLMALLFIIVAAFGVYSYVNYRAVQEKIKALSTAEGQQKLVAEEIQGLIAKMSKHIVLPTGEDPTMATITDIDALKKEQPFYEGASNGDKILIYKKALKGFIYDPNRDLIVNVGPVYFEDQNNTTTNAPSGSISKNSQSSITNK